MNWAFWQKLAERSLAREKFEQAEGLQILSCTEAELPGLVAAAAEVRRKHWGNRVRVHVIDNVENGRCGEDCGYCLQGRLGRDLEIAEYPLKSEAEILAEAEAAFRSGAFRHCLVMSGRGQSDSRIRRIAAVVRELKARFKMEVCVSPGILGEGQAELLREAGLDRINHNLNTTAANYARICTTHSWEDRRRTLARARAAGLGLCSGFIAGLGEGPEGVHEILALLAELQVESIPVNFLMPLPGLPLGRPENLTPGYCLRILCLARLMNPAAEIRMAGGRELHLRGLQSLALFAANSLFMKGYLNVKGSDCQETLRLIQDAGMEVECEDRTELQKLLTPAEAPGPAGLEMKSLADLRNIECRR